MKRIAIFDYRVSPTNPIGGCHRRMLEALSSDYDFTVFAIEFDNPAPERVEFRRVPVPRRPLALLYIAYHVMAPICYWLHRLRRGRRFDLVQTVESNLSFGTIAYTHFCHRTYLKLQSSHLDRRNIRQWFRWLDHRLHAMLEPWVYRHVEQIVVPSQGLAEELAREYPVARGKIQVLYNPVATERMRRPSDFDRTSLRGNLGWSDEDRILVFVALGHFERKGLPALLDGLAQARDPRLRLLVVGGQPGAVAAYEAKVDRLGLRARVRFTGNRSDVRPYLWSADAFVLPSHYEAFPLVVLEAAAAGLPLIATPVHGVRELLRDGENGILVEPNPDSIAAALTRFAGLDRTTIHAMGVRAAKDVGCYAVDEYAPRWRRFYETHQKKTDGHLA
jgi:glycosyltransferase involved in cell wall biosynthesis